MITDRWQLTCRSSWTSSFSAYTVSTRLLDREGAPWARVASTPLRPAPTARPARPPRPAHLGPAPARPDAMHRVWTSARKPSHHRHFKTLRHSLLFFYHCLTVTFSLFNYNFLFFWKQNLRSRFFAWTCHRLKKKKRNPQVNTMAEL